MKVRGIKLLAIMYLWLGYIAILFLSTSSPIALARNKGLIVTFVFMTYVLYCMVNRAIIQKLIPIEVISLFEIALIITLLVVFVHAGLEIGSYSILLFV